MHTETLKLVKMNNYLIVHFGDCSDAIPYLTIARSHGIPSDRIECVTTNVYDVDEDHL